MGFCFDVETLGTESDAVILSAAIVHFNPTDKPTYQELLDNTLFVKFDVKDQIQRLKRTSDKSTLEWWSKQPNYIKSVSFVPKSDDLTAEQGLSKIKKYMEQYPESRTQTMWARGSLDQVSIDSLSRAVDFESISEYYNWRDVRTAIDIIFGTSNGYCDIDHPEFNRDLVLKHHPAHDICLDVMMIIYGKEKE